MVEDLRQAAAAASEAPEFQFNLGLIQHRTGNDQAAVEALTRTVRPGIRIVVASIETTNPAAKSERDDQIRPSIQRSSSSTAVVAGDPARLPGDAGLVLLVSR